MMKLQLNCKFVWISRCMSNANTSQKEPKVVYKPILAIETKQILEVKIILHIAIAEVQWCHYETQL